MDSSGGTLAQGIKKVLEGLSGVGSYIDDIVIYSDSWQEYLRTWKELFGRLKRARMHPIYEMLLGANRMEFPGHQPREGSETLPPTTKKQVRSFLVLVCY